MTQNNIKNNEYQFYGIFYKNKCMGVLHWPVSEMAISMRGYEKPQRHDFHWRAGNKKNLEICKVLVTKNDK